MQLKGKAAPIEPLWVLRISQVSYPKITIKIGDKSFRCLIDTKAGNPILRHEVSQD